MGNQGRYDAAPREEEAPARGLAGDIYQSRCSLPGLLRLFEEESDEDGILSLVYEACGGGILDSIALLALERCRNGGNQSIYPETEAVKTIGGSARPARELPMNEEKLT